MDGNNMQKLSIKNNGFEMRAINEVCDTVTDYVAAGSFADLKKNVEYLSEPDYAQLIRTVDIKSGFSKGNFVYVNKKAFDYLWRVNLNTESIILPNIGNCGEVYYVIPENLPYENNVLATNAILVRSKKESNKYLFYVFQSRYFQDELKKITSPVGQTKFNKTELKNITIPIPHIKIQEEIVEILDSFTNLIDALNEELSLRQKQFEYYREKLLTFDNEEPVKMNDIILNLRTGLNPRTHFKLNTEDADCFYITVRELGLFDIVVDDKTDKINSQAIGRINERSNIQQNDILFSGTGTIGRTALVKNEIYKWNVKEGVYVITPNIMKVNPRYFIYLLHSNYLQIQYEVKAEGGAVKSVSMKEFKSLLVHIPTLAIQQSIVEKLDAFESLISSIKEEIALRQKQYEYYREKLLTFN